VLRRQLGFELRDAGLHRDDIKSMQRYGEKDVLNTMLLQCNWLSASQR
jgi:hypothetical protein